jgi:membrane-associated phospholipid phosphatase
MRVSAVGIGRLREARPLTWPCQRDGLGIGAGLLFLATLGDALLHPPAPWEIRVLKAAQRVEPPGIGTALEASDLLTDSSGAVFMWAVVSLAFAAARWWWPLVAALMLPLGGVINEGIGLWLVARARPHAPELARGSLNWEERSYPSGHVTGAVLLYGLLFIVAGRLGRRWQRLAVRIPCTVIVVVVGFDRLWGGAHWPTDVLASYALGTALLALLLAACDRLGGKVGAMAAWCLALSASAGATRPDGPARWRAGRCMARCGPLAAQGLQALAKDRSFYQ